MKKPISLIICLFLTRQHSCMGMHIASKEHRLEDVVSAETAVLVRQKFKPICELFGYKLDDEE